MTEQRTTYESIAPSIEEAIEKGLSELGLNADNVDVEVLDEGTKGIFGLGSRQARVRLTVKETVRTVPEKVVAEPETPPQLEEETIETETVDELATSEVDQVLQIARDTVAELLEKMKVNAEVTATYLEDEDYHGQKPIWVDIHGDDLSILIGRKAETLNALQYIASLIIGKELGRSVPITVDVEGYRSRRKKQLSQLANRVADQVAKTGRSQALEPMSASERRLIHIELRDHAQVYTESAGEGERRKVIIYPKD